MLVHGYLHLNCDRKTVPQLSCNTPLTFFNFNTRSNVWCEIINVCDSINIVCRHSSKISKTIVHVSRRTFSIIIGHLFVCLPYKFYILLYTQRTTNVLKPFTERTARTKNCSVSNVLVHILNVLSTLVKMW
jgi:hypothetical protein